MNLLSAMRFSLWILLAGLFLTLGGQPTIGQGPPPPAKGTGRYQAAMGGTNLNIVVVCDTHTGQCWTREVNALRWNDLHSPVPPKIGENPIDRTDIIKPGDRLLIEVPGTLPNQPIKGAYRVEPSGKVPLGYSYGRVKVEGLAPEEAEKVIRDHLKELLRNPVVSVIRYDPEIHRQAVGDAVPAPNGTNPHSGNKKGN